MWEACMVFYYDEYINPSVREFLAWSELFSPFLDVTIHEDHWVGETVLQSTFTSQLLNLGSYSSVQPEECKTHFKFKYNNFLVFKVYTYTYWEKVALKWQCYKMFSKWLAERYWFIFSKNENRVYKNQLVLYKSYLKKYWGSWFVFFFLESISSWFLTF